MTRHQAEELVLMLAAAYPNPTVPVATLELYISELELLDSPEIARGAVQQLYRDPDNRFLPTVGQIVEAYWQFRRDERERRERAQAARALPAGDWPDPPADVVDEFLRMGIDLRAMLRTIPPDREAA